MTFCVKEVHDLTCNSFTKLADRIVKFRPVLFCGSGLSLNAGYPTASTLSHNILSHLDEKDQQTVRNRCDLAEVAQLALLKKKSVADIAEYAFGDAFPPERRHPWYKLDEIIERYQRCPPAVTVSIPHLVIARLAREGLISEIVTTNYDCSLEHACWAVGMSRQGSTDNIHCPPTASKQYFQVLNRESYKDLIPDPSVFHIAKIHGCIDDILKKDKSNPTGFQWAHENNLAMAFEDLVSWNISDWAKSFFEDRVKSRYIIIAGFSGSDPYLFATMLECMRPLSPDSKDSKVYVLDPNPSTYLQTLARPETILSEGCCSHCSDTSSLASPCPLYIQLRQAKCNRSRNTSKMACLYADLYSATISNLLLYHLETTGLNTFMMMLGADNAAASHRVKEDVKHFLKACFEPKHEFPCSPQQALFTWLPKALTNLEVFTTPMHQITHIPLSWTRKDFYYPVSEGLESTYLLLASLFQIMQSLPETASLELNPDGTITITDQGAGFKKGNIVLLPLLGRDIDRKANLAEAMVFRRFFNWTQKPMPITNSQSLQTLIPVTILPKEPKTRTENKRAVNIAFENMSFLELRRCLS